MSEPYHFPNYLFLVVPALMFLKRSKWICWLLALSMAFIVSITWNSWIARYLLPAYPSLSICTAYTLITLRDRLKTPYQFAEKIPIYAVSGALGVIVAIGVISLRKFHSVGFVTGSVSSRQVVLPLSYYRPINYINTKLPPDARVMIIGAQLNYGLLRDYTSDESWFATKWRRLLIHNSSLEEVNQDLKREGFTHILFSPRIFTYAAAMGVQGTGGLDLMASGSNELTQDGRSTSPEYSLLRNWASFALYEQSYLEKVYSDKYDYEVFRIK